MGDSILRSSDGVSERLQPFASCIRTLAFSVQRSAFSVQRSAFGVRRSLLTFHVSRFTFHLSPLTPSRGGSQNLFGHLSGNGIKITKIMGDYKGRVNTRRRKRRFAKNRRVKALAAIQKGTTSPTDIAEETKA